MDFTHTNNPTSLFKAAAVAPFPQWVDAAPIPHIDDMRSLSKSAFADTERRLLPLHTKEAAFFSTVDYLDRPDDFSEAVGERVKKACVMFGIENDVLPYWEHAEQRLCKSAASKVDEFAIDVEIGDKRVRMLPLSDVRSVREANDSLVNMAREDRIDYTMLRAGSRNLIKKAAALGNMHDLSNVVLSMADICDTDFEKSASLLAGRGRNADAQASYDAIAAELADGLDPEMAVTKIAAVDMVHGVHNSFERGKLPRPHEIVYCGAPLHQLEKAASTVVLINEDVVIPIAALRAISADDAAFALSKQAAASFRPGEGGAAELSDTIDGWSKADRDALIFLALQTNVK